MTAPTSGPLVSLVTPVYNTAEFLEQCIRSVLAQTYTNFEYIILDNCSTDESPQIAQRFADQDSRVKIVRNAKFLGQVENYNESVTHISRDSKYCKMVQADDWIYPECMAEMVAIAEADESIGMVGAYTLLDFGVRAEVYLAGLPYPGGNFPGKYIGRRYLEEGLYVFGSPTATMLRSDIVRARTPLYHETSAIDDTGICMEVLRDWNFGFCYRVLTCTRRYNDSIMSTLKRYNYDVITRYICMKLYGRDYIDTATHDSCLKSVERQFHHAVGEAVLRRLPSEYWTFLAFALAEAGEKVTSWNKLTWAIKAGLNLMKNPGMTLARLRG